VRSPGQNYVFSYTFDVFRHSADAASSRTAGTSVLPGPAPRPDRNPQGVHGGRRHRVRRLRAGTRTHSAPDCLLIVYRCTRTHSVPDCLLIVYRCTRTLSVPDCLLIVYRCTRTHSLPDCLLMLHRCPRGYSLPFQLHSFPLQLPVLLHAPRSRFSSTRSHVCSRMLRCA